MEIGIINEPGNWDNIPAGEIFTTPDEFKVNGVLVLPVLESMISQKQGVDEFVRVTFKDGVITSITGGESAKELRQKLDEKMQKEIKEGSGNPLNVLRIAEIGFGARKNARPAAADPEKGWEHPATATVEAEKRFGTIHLAIGDPKHGEEGTEGFAEDVVSHYDFVIPRNGLTVEMFTNERDWKEKKNSERVIDRGGLNFF